VQRNHGDIGIDRVQGRARGIDLHRAHRVAAVEDLALQVGEIDLVGVGESQAPDARGREVKRRRAAEAARADDYSVCSPQLLLPLDPDLGEQDVAAVAKKLLVVQT
jgi:hypothetical protein